MGKYRERNSKVLTKKYLKITWEIPVEYLESTEKVHGNYQVTKTVTEMFWKNP